MKVQDEVCDKSRGISASVLQSCLFGSIGLAAADLLGVVTLIVMVAEQAVVEVVNDSRLVGVGIAESVSRVS